MELHLVLHAAGIRSEPVHRGGWWLLVVSSDDVARAQAELADYRRENPLTAREPERRVPTYGGAVIGVAVYAMVIVGVGFETASWAGNLDLFPLGQVDAGRVMAGEYWRTFTALTLHVDAGHLIANLVFGSLFGFLAGRLFGGGVAWLVIVPSAALGNWINAALHPASHLSVGASTAAFAALGVVVAQGIRHWRNRQVRAGTLWTPLIGAVLLFGYTGVGGERTDVGAHVGGLVAGLLGGWCASYLPARWLERREIQVAAGVLALALLIMAWVIGISQAGSVASS